MKKLFAFIIIWLFVTLQLQAQKQLWADSFAITSSPINKWHDLLRLHDPVLYLAPVPQVISLQKRNIKLLEGEGKKGYWLEGNLTQRFVLARWNERHRPAWQRMRITFDAGISTRMTRDSSSPLLPNNNRFGIGYDLLLHKVNKLNDTRKPDYWFTAQMHHFSNGQAGKFFVDTNKVRNNYRSGDFSTNYIRVLLMRTKRSKRDNLFSTGIGLQREINIGGPLVLSDELENYYGRNRLLFNYQWIRHPQTAKKTFTNKSGNEEYDAPSYKKWMLIYRSEMEYIFDDVSLYPYPAKYRLGWHQYLSYFFNTENDLGFMAHTYIGRDYMNIRFDDPVFIFQLGIVIRPVRK
jgi:hypothetical protein